jgi:serine/threonine-protein phosphatase 6 catalytic subunit
MKCVRACAAPNYCYRCGNVAAVLRMLAGGGREQVVFDAVPEDKRTVPIKNASPYFL